MPGKDKVMMEKLIQARKERGKRAGTTGYAPGRMPIAPAKKEQTYTKKVMP